jgi:hypothetical protein
MPTTLCRGYTTEDDARAAVERLLAAGLPGEEIRVLMGAPVRDSREARVGRFGGGAADPAEPVGAFAGARRSEHDAMGGFAGMPEEQRRGSFGDLDRETVTDYRDGIAHMRVASHRDLKRALVAAGLDERAAAADVQALHAGRTLVLVRTGPVAPDIAAAALDA